MGAVGGGIDQPVPAVRPGVDVAAPEVAVDPGRRLGRPGELADPLDHPADRGSGGGVDPAARRGQRCRAARAGPRSGHPSREPGGTASSGSVTPAEAQRPARRARRQGVEARGAGPVNDRQAAPELLLAARSRRPRLDPFERQPERAGLLDHREHARDRQAAGLGQPGQPRGLGAVLVGGGVAPALQERAGSVRQIEQPGVVDVAAADPPRPLDAGAERPAGGGERSSAAHQAALSSPRISSSSPSQARSTMSRTSSKPPSPP